MRQMTGLAWLMALVAVPAMAQDKTVDVSVGYAFSHYLEEGGGNAPLGAYLSVAMAKKVGLEADIAYHRDSEDVFGDTIVLNTFTAGVGPRFSFRSGKTKPFVHVLGAMRYDSIRGESNTAFGGAAGGGVDVPIASSVAFRLGADFQIVFDQGENLKTLRLAAGFTF